MANQVLGVHLAPGALKVVALEAKAGSYQVLKWSIKSIPSENEATVLAALQSAIKEINLPIRQAVLVTSNAENAYKLVELPVVPEKEVLAALKFKLEAVLPKGVASSVVSYYKAGELQTAKKLMLFAGAISKDGLNRTLDIMKKAGLSVIDVVAASSALLNAGKVKGTAASSAIVYMGRFSSVIVLVKHGQVEFAREFSVGSEDITKSLVGSLQTASGRIDFDYAKAQSIKEQYGIPVNPQEYSSASGLPGAEILGMMQLTLEKIGAEILRTFEYYQEASKDQSNFEKVYFTGGGSQIPQLKEYFQDMLGKEVDFLPLTAASSQAGFAKVAPQLSLAIGAATLSPPFLSFLPQDMRTDAFTLLRKYVNIWAVALTVAIVAGLLLFYAVGKDVSERMELAKLQKIYKQQLVDESMKKSRVLGAQAKVMQQIGGIAGTDRFVTLTNTMSRILPKDIYFQSVTYDRLSNLFVIKGIVLQSGSQKAVANFIDGLKATGLFDKIDCTSLQVSDAYNQPVNVFQLNCLLNGSR